MFRLSMDSPARFEEMPDTFGTGVDE